ncbi:hypothetical protein LCGC14_1343920 [marine sediment metagenome]|uniref:NYN domain-containing protein n=1 Tax=marine sediment metagenome TaxID=412755 RepID=A0A0F9KCV2_9ZZZZ
MGGDIKMHFLFKSEVETVDIKKNYYKKRLYCPDCFKIQLKKLDSSKYYNKYQCWNKDCKANGTPFAVLNVYIKNEENFDDCCDSCQEPLHRKFIHDGGENLLLQFKCSGKLCESNIDPYSYNLRTGEWEGKPPKIVFYDDSALSKSQKFENEIKKKQIKLKKNRIIEENEQKLIDSLPNQETYEATYKIEDIPLLTMNSSEYTNFLDRHQQKVVVLVDLPNFIRTLRELFPHNFEDVLRKAHDGILQYIENSFHTSKDYIIRYFSKPAKDLEIPNNIIINLCSKNSNKEIFHLLKLPKGGGYSDIDNYLIANGVEILERCEIRGFVIVSSDKDYLPVMRIASYKKIKSRIIGINTPEIYEKYNITDIKFLGIMKFFEK